MNLKDLKKEQIIEATLILKDEVSKGKKRIKELKTEIKEEKKNNKLMEKQILQLECILNTSLENNEEYCEENIRPIFAYTEHVKDFY